MDIRIKNELDTVLNTKKFIHSKRKSNLLKYLINKKINKPGKEIKEITIATELYGLTNEYDTSSKSMIRNEIYRLRECLKEYYENNPSDIQFTIPYRNFSPKIIYRIDDFDILLYETEFSNIYKVPTIIIIADISKNVGISKDILSYLYEEITLETLKYKNFKLATFKNKTELNDFFEYNYDLFNIQHDILLLLDIEIIQNKGMFSLSFTMEDLEFKKNIWNTKESVIISTNCQLCKIIRDLATMVCHILFDEMGIIYKYIF